MVGDLIDEVAVVRNHDHTPLERLQVLFQYAERHDVQVVRRLVEDQEIGTLHQNRTKIQAFAFAAAEPCDIAVLHLGREEEILQKLRGAHPASVAQVNFVGDIGHDVDNLLSLVEVQPLLAVIAEADAFAHLDRAAVGPFDAGEQLQEGRFAAAVVPDDAQLVVPGEVVVETIEDHQIPETLAEVFGFEYLGADARGLNVEFQRRLRTGTSESGFQFVKRVDAGPGFGRPRLGLAAHPLQLAAVKVQIALAPGFGRFGPLLLLLDVVGVIAFV